MSHTRETLIGKSVPRPDAVAKATGAAQYTDDIFLPNMLHGALLRSPYAHALIRKIDTSRDANGDEIPTWLVYVGDEEAEPTGTVYTCFTFSFALDLAQRMARDRRLQLIHEAIAA